MTQTSLNPSGQSATRQHPLHNGRTDTESPADLEDAHAIVSISVPAVQRLNLTPSAVGHGLRRLRRLLHDPLFLKTPSGVKPTDRARALAGQVAEVLTRVEGIVSTAGPFDPKNAKRCFTIGAPDALAAIFLGPLVACLARKAPNIDEHDVRTRVAVGKIWGQPH